jgi:uncharacterized membrane protein
MSNRTKSLYLYFILTAGILFLSNLSVLNAAEVKLYTPYTKIAVPPGESIDYTIDVINNSNTTQNIDISISGFPGDWSYILKSGGWDIKQLSVLPDEKKSLSLKVEVPLQVNKGNYRFNVVAGGLSTLPLTIIVSEQGTFRTEFTTKQANMEGHAKSNFNFSAELKNRTAEKQLYALKAEAPRGWNVSFKANQKQVTSVEIEANNTTSVTVEIDPPDNSKAATYQIPITAATNATSARLDLEVVITGSYAMELTTPTGLLSTDITAGSVERVELVVKNTGSSELNDIKLSFSAPAKWDVTFEPDTITQLVPGGSTHVFAGIKADKKAIPGDYVVNLEAKTPEVSSKASFRMSVETRMLWGWIGVLIILAALGSVYRLFRKYGRR